MIEIEFVGAAQSVTGSMHVVRTDRATLLLDCGLFQGRRREALERNRRLGVDPLSFDAVVLSHAHIDHSGALPVLVSRGYQGPIHATPATRDLCAAMLVDAAMIQAADARYLNKQIERDDLDEPRVEPLYTETDVARTLEAFDPLPYHRRRTIAPGVELSFLDAGHVLGSAIVQLDLESGGRRTRLVFTGDLGRHQMPILRDPEVPSGVDVLLIESTYGDRTHPPIEEVDEALGAVIRRTHARGGKVVIPTFALERAQEIIFALKKLALAGEIPRLPVYVDSPLTVKLTEVFKLHPDCFDEEARAHLHRDSPFEFDGLRYVEDRDESKAISASSEPCVVISASGMCESGRVLHHLRATIGDPRSTICIVGFQAQHTLGRRLVEGRTRVRIFGVERDRNAEVVVLNGFSAHADRDDLVAFVEGVRARGDLREVALIHGELPAQTALAATLRGRGFTRVSIPKPGERRVIA
jgi:metallo-beta-lactamase family protein